MTSALDSEQYAALQDDLAYHQARVLLLVVAVARTDGHARKLDGLTKLAKLDFLTRYPMFAAQVLEGVAWDDQRLHLLEDDVRSAAEVEAPMIRYKYGPWDDRYYAIVGALVGRGLLKYVTGRKGNVALAPTPAGRTTAAALADTAEWHDTADRCLVVAEASRGLTGNALKERIYSRLPDLMDRPHRETIK